jgi:hypothetical protein
MSSSSSVLLVIIILLRRTRRSTVHGRINKVLGKLIQANPLSFPCAFTRDGNALLQLDFVEQHTRVDQRSGNAFVLFQTLFGMVVAKKG